MSQEITNQGGGAPPEIHLPVAGDPPPPPPPEGSGFGRAHHVLLIFCGVAFVAWVLSGFYTVNTDEVAIVERLGTYETTGEGKAVRLVEQGLQYHLPWPIDTVHKVPIQRSSALVVRTFNEPPDAYADFKRMYQREGMRPELLSAIFDPYLITGDKNIVHMEITVRYRLDDPDAWLNTVAHDGGEAPGVAGKREELFQHLVEHALIGQLAHVPIDNILFEGLDRLPPMLTNAINENLELPDPRDPTGVKRSHLGIHVERVDGIVSHPPQMVQPNFDRVFKARQSMEKAKIDAQSAAQSAIIDAQGSTQTQIREAEAYRSQTIDAAKGEASQFAQIFERYKIAPDITRWNVYVDAVKAVSTSADRMIFAQPGQRTFLTIDPPTFDANQAAPR